MPTRTKIIGVILLWGNLGCGLAVHAALAQSSSSPTVAKVDKDNDQTLDLNEVKVAAGAHFDQMNKDGDQTLEPKEVLGIIGPTMFKEADSDHDGSLSKDEYLAVVEKLFKKADVDHDGTLSVKELRTKSAHILKQLID